MIDQTVWLAPRATAYTVVCEECAAEQGEGVGADVAVLDSPEHVGEPAGGGAATLDQAVHAVTGAVLTSDEVPTLILTVGNQVVVLRHHTSKSASISSGFTSTPT